MQYKIQISGSLLCFITVFLIEFFIAYVIGILASLDIMWFAHLDKPDKAFLIVFIGSIGGFMAGVAATTELVKFDDIAISSKY